MGSMQRRSMSINIHGSSLSRGASQHYSTPQVRFTRTGSRQFLESHSATEAAFTFYSVQSIMGFPATAICISRPLAQ